METITLAGGCFWCTEATFKRVKGVVSVESGYSGGSLDSPTYQEVSEGNTGYAESIQIKFDPGVISLERLLDIFWVLHDPTTLNRQGGDIGTQYRSAIFYRGETQKRIAFKSKEEMEKKKEYKEKIVTEIVPFKNFYKAEDYHQNFYERSMGTNTYCSLVIDPKIQKLVDEFGKEVKDKYL